MVDGHFGTRERVKVSNHAQPRPQVGQRAHHDSAPLVTPATYRPPAPLACPRSGALPLWLRALAGRSMIVVGCGQIAHPIHHDHEAAHARPRTAAPRTRRLTPATALPHCRTARQACTAARPPHRTPGVHRRALGDAPPHRAFGAARPPPHRRTAAPFAAAPFADASPHRGARRRTAARPPPHRRRRGRRTHRWFVSTSAVVKMAGRTWIRSERGARG